MKKKQQGQKKSLVSTKLYKNDLEEIFETLKPFQIEVSDEEFQYDSVEELEVKKGKKINELTLSISDPMFTLRLSRHQSYLIRGPEVETITPYIQIESLLKSRKRPILTAIFNPISFIPICVAAFFLMSYLKRFFTEATEGNYVGICIILILGLFIPFAIYHGGGFSQVVLTYKHEEQSFWIRNRDQIILSLISAIAGGIVAWFITYLTMRN